MYVSFSMDFDDQSGSPTTIRKAKLEKQVRVVLHAWPQFLVSYRCVSRSSSSSSSNNRQVIRLLSAKHASCPGVCPILCQYLQISFHTWIIRACIFLLWRYWACCSALIMWTFFSTSCRDDSEIISCMQAVDFYYFWSRFWWSCSQFCSWWLHCVAGTTQWPLGEHMLASETQRFSWKHLADTVVRVLLCVLTFWQH